MQSLPQRRSSLLTVIVITIATATLLCVVGVAAAGMEISSPYFQISFGSQNQSGSEVDDSSSGDAINNTASDQGETPTNQNNSEAEADDANAQADGCSDSLVCTDSITKDIQLDQENGNSPASSSDGAEDFAVPDANDAVDDALETVDDTVDDVTDEVEDTVDDSGDLVDDLLEDLDETVDDVEDTIDDVLDGLFGQ